MDPLCVIEKLCLIVDNRDISRPGTDWKLLTDHTEVLAWNEIDLYVSDCGETESADSLLPVTNRCP